MVDSVLIKVFGDSINLRILSFFLESPFEKYTVSQISEFAEVSRNSVYKYLPLFLEKEYLINERKGSRDVYKLNRSSKIVSLLDDFSDEVGDIQLQPQIDKIKTRQKIIQRDERTCLIRPYMISAAA